MENCKPSRKHVEEHDEWQKEKEVKKTKAFIQKTRPIISITPKNRGKDENERPKNG